MSPKTAQAADSAIYRLVCSRSFLHGRTGSSAPTRLLRLKLYFLKYGPLRSVAVRRRARRLGAPVQELPNAHKLVRLYCLPLRGRHAESSCPTNVERTLAVGRDDSARRCRNYQMRTNPFVCTVCRFADGTPSGRALRMWNAPSP